MKVHEQAKYYKAKAEWLEADLSHLLHYVASDKFHEDQSVNTADIQMRIQECFTTLYRDFPD
jgi:hypothetical protein